MCNLCSHVEGPKAVHDMARIPKTPSVVEGSASSNPAYGGKTKFIVGIWKAYPGR
jgi:hypothetical protein